MIYLLRHGETVWNREGRAQGRGDSPLTWRGIGHARAYAESLVREIEDVREVRLYTSPLYRARQTAQIVADRLGIEAASHTVSPLLAELDCGDWEGMTAEEMRADDPDRFEVRSRDPWSGSPPGGESRAEVHRRAAEWLEATPRGERTIVVAHGIVSRVLRGAYLGLSADAILGLDSHRHGCFFRLDQGRVDTLEASELDR